MLNHMLLLHHNTFSLYFSFLAKHFYLVSCNYHRGSVSISCFVLFCFVFISDGITIVSDMITEFWMNFASWTYKGVISYMGSGLAFLKLFSCLPATPSACMSPIHCDYVH